MEFEDNWVGVMLVLAICFLILGLHLLGSTQKDAYVSICSELGMEHAEWDDTEHCLKTNDGVITEVCDLTLKSGSYVTGDLEVYRYCYEERGD